MCTSRFFRFWFIVSHEQECCIEAHYCYHKKVDLWEILINHFILTQTPAQRSESICQIQPLWHCIDLYQHVSVQRIRAERRQSVEKTHVDGHRRDACRETSVWCLWKPSPTFFTCSAAVVASGLFIQLKLVKIYPFYLQNKILLLFNTFIYLFFIFYISYYMLYM